MNRRTFKNATRAVKSILCLVFTSVLLTAMVPKAFAATIINGHTLTTDASGSIISWVPDQNQAYDTVSSLAWNYLLNQVPNDPNTQKPAYFSQSYLNPDTQAMAGWPSNPAGMNAMLIESAISYYRYSGNAAVLNLVKSLADHHLQQGMTQATDNWPNVPYASGDAGSLTYHGATYGNTTGVGDGAGYIEPDKVGEFGFALLELYEETGVTAYRDAAINAANALASHVTTGTASQSPWPFRVNAQTGAVREQYSSHVISPIELFDELSRLNLGNTAAYQTARATAWNWLMTYPMVNNQWSGYFEDVAIQTDTSNTNQYDAMMVARYLLEHPETDANWQTHVRGLIAWVESTFGTPQFGATTIREQQAFMHPMGSHTSRYASVNALLYEKTGDAVAKDKAYRAFNYATYMSRGDGIDIDGTEVNNQWFTDGYGDYIRHFMVGMGAVPDWAPNNQTHLLESSSVISAVIYGTNLINYTTYDTAGTETIKTASAPTSVSAGGVQLAQRTDLLSDGWTYDPSTSVLKIRHTNSGTIAVGLNGVIANQIPTVSISSPANNATYTAPASVTLTANASDQDGTISQVEFYQDGSLVGTVASSPYSVLLSNVASGSHSYVAKAYDNSGAVGVSATVTITVANPAGSWTGTDVGSVGVAGSTTVNGGTVTIKGSGVDIWDVADSFHFAYQTMTGDGAITARVASQQNTDPWALGGVMMRDGLSANAKEVLAAVTPANGASFDYRSTVGGATTYVNGGTASAPYWVRLTRSGNTITAAKSANGTTWTTMGSTSITLSSTLYVGMAVTSHNNSILATDTFDSVAITGQTGGDTTPPVISSISAGSINQNGATISWATDEPSTSQIDYGTTTSYGLSTALNSSLDTAHTQVISGINAATTYHYRVKSTDAAGNTAISADQTFSTPSVPDSQAPTAPTNVIATAISSSQVNITWTAATDNVGVTSYLVFRDGVQVGTSTSTTYSDSGLTANTTYAYTVYAADAAGNISTASNTASTTTFIAPALAVDVQVVKHQNTAATSVVSPAITTAGAGELLVAFVSSDGAASSGTSSFSSVSGGGLTWTLRKRANTQAGTSEIWTAPATVKLTSVTITATRSGSYRSSLVVAAFKGADLSAIGATAGASGSTGAPTVSLTTTRANSWVWAVGNDWDNAIARTPGSNQTKVDEFLTGSGDTLWVQRQTNVTGGAGTVVTTNDTAPTSDRWNLAAIEILSAQ